MTKCNFVLQEFSLLISVVTLTRLLSCFIGRVITRCVWVAVISPSFCTVLLSNIDMIIKVNTPKGSGKIA